MDDNTTPDGDNKKSLRDRGWDRLDQAGRRAGQYAGDKVGGAADRGQDYLNQAKQTGSNLTGYAGRVMGGGGAGKVAGTEGKATKVASNEGKAPGQDNLSEGEGVSNNRSTATQPKSLKALEAAGTAAITLGGAAATATGDLQAGAAIIQEALKDPIGFLKKNLLGGVIIGSVSAMCAALIITMIIFIPIFAITHFAETVKNTALKLTYVDEAWNAGRAVTSGLGKAVDGLGDVMFGETDTLKARLAIANMSNTAHTSPTPTEGQILLAQARESGGQSTEVSQLLDQLDFSKILKNLGEEGKLTFYSNGQLIPAEELNSRQLNSIQIRVGSKRLDIPNDPTTPEFLADLSLLIRESDLFAHTSRTRVSRQMKQVYTDNGVVLNRWQGKAEDITDYGKNVKSAFTAISSGNMRPISTDLKDVDEAGSKLQDSANELLDADPGAGNKNFIQQTINKAWATEQDGNDAATIADFATRSGSPALFTIASYCSAKSYINPTNYQTIVNQQYSGAIRNGLKVLSAADQIETGDVRRQAVGAESQRREGYETSRAYLRAIGSDVRNRQPDLNEAQLGVLDPTIVFSAMQGVVNLFEQPFSDQGFVDVVAGALDLGGGGGWLDNLTDTLTDFATDALGAVTGIVEAAVEILGGDLGGIVSQVGTLLCKGMSNDEASVAIRIAEQFSQAPTEVGSASVLATIKNKLEQRGATTLIEQLGLNQSAFNKPTEEMMYFMFDTQKALNYAGLDTNVDLASKEFEGVEIFGNELSRINGGRPLNFLECATAKASANVEEIVLRNKQPLLTRLFNPSQTKSPVALGLAHVPLSPAGAVNKTKLAISSSLNPLNTVASSTQKLAFATTLADNEAYAQSTPRFVEDRQPCFGYTPQEREKIANDATFWPIQNAEIVESQPELFIEPFEECYDRKMPDLMLAGYVPDIPAELSLYTGKCSGGNLSTDNALRYRTYRGDLNQFESLVDFQEVSATTTGGPNGPLPGESVAIKDTAVTKGCGGIRVHKSILKNIDALCAAAAANKTDGREDPINLTGGGYRDPEEQIALRKEHCGTSDYAIYEMPSSQCSPPTAKPGTSRHERGVAIDFKGIPQCPSKSGEFCTAPGNKSWEWLNQNANKYGLQQLKLEAWHWSTDGG